MLFLVPLLFVAYLPFEFLIFNHSAFIHDINLSAGAQSITGAYIIIMLVCRHLFTMHLLGKAAV